MGCSHACVYCYARAFTRYKEVSSNWGKIVYIKENIIDVLKSEVNRLRKGVVGVSTITDPYQPVEAEEKLTRRGIEILAKNGFHVSVQTKSPLVVRDLDIISSYKDFFDVGFTITTLDSRVAGVIEPGAPPPPARVEALRRVSSLNVETWVFLGPIMRGVNDSRQSIEAVVRVAFETGSRLYYDFYHHKPEVVESMKTILPAYPQAMGETVGWREEVVSNVERICRETGIECIPAFKPRKPARKIIDYF